MDFTAALEATLVANVKIICLVSIGAALTYSGHIDQRGVSDLGTIGYFVALPSLIFTNVGASLHAEDLQTLYVFPMTAVLYVVAGYALAWVLCKALAVPVEERHAVQAAIMFGNTGSLAIALLSALSFAGAEEDEAIHFQKKAITYCALFIVGQNIVMFSWGEALLRSRPKLEYSPAHDSDRGDGKNNDKDNLDIRTDTTSSTRRDRLAIPAAVAEEDTPMLADSIPENQTATQAAPPRDPPTSSSSSAGRSRPAPPPTLRKADPRMSASQPNLDRLAEYGSTRAEPLRERSHSAVLRRQGSGFLSRYPQLSHEDVQRLFSRIPLFSSAFAGVDEYDSDRDDETRSQESLPLASQSKQSRKRRRRSGFKRALVLGGRALKSPPLIAAILGVLVALTPPLRALFFGSHAPLSPLTQALESCGRMQVPSSMIMLSGAGTIRIMEELHAESFAFSKGSRAIILFTRSTCMAIVGVAWCKFCIWSGMSPPDGLIPFVLILEAIVPSAQNVVMLLLVHGDAAQGRAMAMVILEQYAVAIPFITFGIVLSVVYLQPFAT
ncbi:Hypothetical Protein FCC1311_024302 [Hondaea fermentalgiana]|uniref:Auxin efflux carrier n=1 Tax=Hondaea fermentalgiana TaxID=2315210 RepID=A0A2R5G7A6_9STRA|nr:Hypothetical Protein FCC1311_024302 [Hondaea fermentalgiana]|eukprot:GBG26209.1 Hypothetical Protein FCC1311_024302 [Hondaea fermentalgiana]